ncbi:MAG: hypothetical protein EAZ28_00110 [Oscillatoriales cyanobacterium]|nr:MAG: hypothetical protein EAZ28_00110 [Oscillatoriales cyanobacterium]
MTQTLSKPPATQTKYNITWEKLPDDFKLPDDPVENIDQPLLAAALREALELAGFIIASMLIASNFGLCAKVKMEFLSDTKGSEYSTISKYPYGKWRFYEQILQVPVYAIFDPKSGELEVYLLVSGQYTKQEPDANSRFWIESMGLFLGVWSGKKSQRTGYWLRWWDENGNLLLWGAERVEQEQQRADEERQRADRLMAYLISQGIDPDAI